MLSTPQAIMSSASPQITWRDASMTACRPEAQRRFTVLPATDTGNPASKEAILATLRLCSDEVWELSRFAAVDFSRERPSAGFGQFSSPVAVELLRTAIACAQEHKVRWLITVSPLGVERLLVRAGFKARRLAPPLIVDGVPIFACSIEALPALQPVQALSRVPG